MVNSMEGSKTFDGFEKHMAYIYDLIHNVLRQVIVSPAGHTVQFLCDICF